MSMPPNDSAVSVPGLGDVRVRLTVLVVAKNRTDGREVTVSVPAVPEQAFSLPGTGRGRCSVAVRVETSGSRSYRVVCEAELPADWVLYAVALRLVLPDLGWHALIPSGWGREIAEFPDDFEFQGTSPGWSALAQLLILQGPSGGLSFSACDPDLELKHHLEHRDGGELPVARRVFPARRGIV